MLHIDANPVDREYSLPISSGATSKQLVCMYPIRVSSASEDPIGFIFLDPEWSGRGKEAQFIYLNRNFLPVHEEDWGPVVLNLMLIEPIEGSEVMRRVSACKGVRLENWREVRPVWKMITLA